MLHVSLRRGQVRIAAWCLLLALATAAPAGVAIAQSSPATPEEEAAALAADGRHLEAAARYEQAARRGFFSWDARLALRAAREYAAAGEPDEARRLADKARGRVRGDEEQALLALVDASLAFAEGDAAGALARLADAPRSLPPPLAAEALELRGRAEIMGGQHLAGLRSFEARAALLADDAARAENERRLFDELMLHPPAAVVATPGMSERERGWLELPAVVAAAGSATPAEAAARRRLQDWLRQYPAHPGAAFIPRTAGTVASASFGPDATIALLLPLSGRHQAAGLAVRDGFAAAWFSSGAADARTRVEIYDTAADAATAYRQALADGARVVVGPLLKDDVLAMLAANPSGLPVPTLALNAPLADGNATPAFLYQFALDPEHEARAIAHRIADDGRTRGIALFPDNAWGQRIRAAFVDEAQRLGTPVVSSVQFYDPAAQDFSSPLRRALGRFGGAGDRPADRSHPAPPRNAAAEQAAGPQFAFIAATPQAARAIRPQLRFQMTYDLPVYATSDAWEPGARAATDLEGTTFPEMPWLLNGGQGAPELWDALHDEWAPRARGQWRLFAFGHDAFRLAQQLASGSNVAGVDGLTGALEVSRESGLVRRSVQFARIEAGRPLPATTAPATTAPAPPAAIAEEPLTNATGAAVPR